MCFRTQENVLTRIALQKFFAAFIAEHAHESVVDFNEASVGAAEKQSLLNIVEEFAVAAFGFAAIGDVFEDMDGLQSFTAGGVHLRGGHQEGALQRGVDIVINEIFSVAT